MWLAAILGTELECHRLICGVEIVELPCTTDLGAADICEAAGVRNISGQLEPLITKGFATAHTT